MNVARLAARQHRSLRRIPADPLRRLVVTNVELERWSGAPGGGAARARCRAGDRVLAPDRRTRPRCWRASSRSGGSGAVPLPATPQLGPNEVRHLLADSEAMLALTSPDLLHGCSRRVVGCRARAVAVRAPARRAIAAPARGLDPDPGLRRLRRCAGAPAVEDVGSRGRGRLAARCAPDCRDDELALLLYTSGTTGKPKGVMMSQRAMVGFSPAQDLHLRR